MEFNDILLYSTPQGEVKIEVIYEGETFWLNQKRMSELFAVNIPTINEHLKNIYQSQELQQETTIRKIRIVQLRYQQKLQKNWRKIFIANLG
jgi:hypothetical protein